MAANSWFSVLTTTGDSLTSHHLFSTSLRPSSFFIPKADSQNQNHKRKVLNKSSSSPPEKVAGKQKFSRRSKNEGPFANADGRSSTSETGRSQSTAIKSFGLQKKGKGVLLDSKDQQVETGSIQDAAFLNAVVKVYCAHTAPDYSLPWQKQRQFTSTGSAFMIGDGKLLTNVHCVEHDTQVKVKKRGDDTKYVAKVLARGVACDIALLSVESKEFWEGADPLNFGRLPRLQGKYNNIPSIVTQVGSEEGKVYADLTSTLSTSHTFLLGRLCISSMPKPSQSSLPHLVRHRGHFHLGPNIFISNHISSSFPCLGVLLQKLENPALRACLKVPSNEGVLVRKVEPTSDISNVVKEGDVIVSFDGVHVWCEGTVPFRSSERIAFRYLISQK